MAYFHGVERYNCCQAVLKTFQKCYEVSDEIILDAKRFGGGRAPDNICGALHALYLLAPAQEDALTRVFQKEVGSHFCSDIRSKKLLSCRSCVGVASAIFAEFIGSN